MSTATSHWLSELGDDGIREPYRGVQSLRAKSRWWSVITNGIYLVAVKGRFGKDASPQIRKAFGVYAADMAGAQETTIEAIRRWLGEAPDFVLKVCPACSGAGSFECKECDGEGEKYCDHCGFDNQCRECRGEGRKTCRTCKGQKSNEPIREQEPGEVAGASIDRKQLAAAIRRLSGPCKVAAGKTDCKTNYLAIVGEGFRVAVSELSNTDGRRPAKRFLSKS